MSGAGAQLWFWQKGKGDEALMWHRGPSGTADDTPLELGQLTGNP